MDTVIEIKKKIFEKVKDTWEDHEEIEDEWINSVLYMNIRNNSQLDPKTKGKYSYEI